MNKYEIITVPDPVLKTRTEPVDRVDAVIREQIDRMLATMYGAPGIGLAANQVGLLNRVLVMDLSSREKEKNPISMVNPEIIWESEEYSIMEEGCLSVPGPMMDRKALMFASLYHDTLFIMECSAHRDAFARWKGLFLSIVGSVDYKKTHHEMTIGNYRNFMADPRLMFPGTEGMETVYY